MGLINADATFGQGALTFPTNLRTFIVGQSGQAVLQASATDLVNIQELFIDNGNITVTGQNMVLLTERLLVNGGADPGTIPTVDLTNTYVQQSETLTDSPQFKCNLTAPNAIFQYTGGDAGSNGWGIYGQAGTTAVTWNIPGAQFWGQNNWSVLINALTQDSDLTGVRFVDQTGNFGAYSELPFFDFTGLVHGNFTRTFGGGRFLWAVTGGPERASLSIGNNWSIMAQNDLSGFTAAGGTTNVGCDENVHVFLINQYRPTIPVGQAFDALRRSGTGNGQMTVAQGWNPVFVDPAGADVTTWRAFGYSGGDLSGTNFVLRPLPLRKDTSVTPTTSDVPTGVTSIAEGVLYNTTAQNGFLVVDQEFTISGIGVSLEGHPDKTLRVYDYRTQTGDEIGMDINLTFPSNGMNREEAIAAGENINVQEITTSAVGATQAGFIDLGWAQEDRRTFSLDENIPSNLTEADANSSNQAATSESTIFQNWYGLVKEFYIRNDLRETITWPLGASSGTEIVIDRNLMFEAQAAQAAITADTVSLRHGNQAFTAIGAVDIKNTLRMTGLNNTVTWGTRTFPNNITLAGGVHNIATTSETFMQNVSWSFDGTTRIHFTGLPAGEYDVHDLLGTVTQPPGSNTLQISAANAGITLFTTDANYFNDWIAFPNPGSNVTLDTRLPPKRYLLSTGSLAGRVGVYNTTINQSLLPGGVLSVPVVAGTPFELEIDVNTSGVNDGDQVRLYYKPNNTLTTGYQMVTESMNINDLGSGDVIIHTPAVAISPELFIDSTEAAVPTGVTATCTGIINSRVNFDIDGATVAPTGQETQRLLLGAVDNDNYHLIPCCKSIIRFVV